MLGFDIGGTKCAVSLGVEIRIFWGLKNGYCKNRF